MRKLSINAKKSPPLPSKRAKLEPMTEGPEEDECDPHDIDDHEKIDDEKILPHIQAFHESIQKDFEDMVSEILTFQRTEEQYEAPEPFGDGNMSVPTAKANDGGLEVLGRLEKPVGIFFEGCSTGFEIQPVVLRGLAMPVNLGWHWMERNRVDALGSQNAIKLRHKLVKIPSKEDLPEVGVHVIGDHKIPAISLDVEEK